MTYLPSYIAIRLDGAAPAAVVVGIVPEVVRNGVLIRHCNSQGLKHWVASARSWCVRALHSLSTRPAAEKSRLHSVDIAGTARMSNASYERIG